MVKNESKIVSRMILSALPIIDAAVICDTGSTDYTIDVACAAVRDKQCVVVKTAWRDFGYNRTQAVIAGQRHVTYFGYNPTQCWLLLLDADHILHCDAFDKEALDSDVIRIFQDDGFFRYQNVRLVRASQPAKYTGRTHEYISVEGSSETLNNIWIEDKNDGGSKADKFERDLSFLMLDWNEKNNGRTAFYMAQTYWCLGRYTEAAAWYEKRISMARPHESEEAWYSRLSRGRCLANMKDIGAEIEFLKSFGMRPWRAESLHELAKINLDRNQCREACALATVGLSLPFPIDETLFVEKKIYQWDLRRDIAIGSFYTSDSDLGRRQCEYLRLTRGSPYREEALRNITFYVKKLPSTILPVPFTAEYGWYPCNPSIIKTAHRYLIAVRTVNYTIDPGHCYKLPDDGVVRTRTFAFRNWNGIEAYSYPESVIELEQKIEHKSWVQGLEDVRIYAVEGGDVFALANRSDWGPMIDGKRLYPRMMKVRWKLSDGSLIEERPIDIKEIGSSCEKNWLPFVDHERHLAIYWHEPFQIIDLDTSAIVSSTLFSVYDLSGFRGSAAPIPWDGGWLYVIHEVTNRTVNGKNEYFYLHRFCWMTSEYVLNKISDLFFLDTLGVEFCCGMTTRDDGVILSFGVKDNVAKLAVVSKKVIDAYLLPEK